jgi:hypothetical protein
MAARPRSLTKADVAPQGVAAGHALVPAAEEPCHFIHKFHDKDHQRLHDPELEVQFPSQETNPHHAMHEGFS